MTINVTIYLIQNIFKIISLELVAVGVCVIFEKIPFVTFFLVSYIFYCHSLKLGLFGHTD